jgi:hypothetical protein
MKPDELTFIHETVLLTLASYEQTALTTCVKPAKSDTEQCASPKRQGAMFLPIFSGLAQWHAKSSIAPGISQHMQVKSRYFR